jgi:hypothetical protein
LPEKFGLCNECGVPEGMAHVGHEPEAKRIGDQKMKKGILSKEDHGAGEAPPGWITILGVQINGQDLAVQIDENIIPQLTRERVERIITRVKDSLYSVRPDLRPQ